MNDDRIRPVPATGACQIRFCVYISAVWGLYRMRKGASMTERTTDITRDLCDSQSQALYDDHAGQPVDETKTEKKYRIDAEELNENSVVFFPGFQSPI